MRSGKRQMTKGIEIQNQEKIRMHREKETYEYFKMLEADHYQTTRDERKD